MIYSHHLGQYLYCSKVSFTVRIVISLLFFSLLTSKVTYGVNSHSEFKKYTVRNGLSENYINCIFQDSKGFIWIGTNDGLNRFDGYNFKTFRYQPKNKSGISTNLINSVGEDSDGNLWIGTVDEGMCVFNPRTEEFSLLRNSARNPKLLSKNSTGHVVVDSKDNIWFENSNGLYVITPPVNLEREITKAKISHIELDKGWYSKNITKIVEVNYNTFLAGSQGGLFLVKLINDSLAYKSYKISKSGSSFVSDITPFKDGYIVSFHHDLYFLEFTNEEKKEAKLSLILNINADEILMSKENILWCATDKGMASFKINRSDLRATQTAQFKKDKFGTDLNNSSINRFFEDQSGLIWIGTHGGGLILYNPNKKKFNHFFSSDEKGSISSNIIRSIYEDPYKNLFIGTEDAGINILASDNSRQYQNGFLYLGLGSTNDQQMTLDFILRETDEQKLWVGVGYPNKIISFNYPDILTGKAKLQTYDDLSYRPVYDFLIDSDSTFWFGSYIDGLHRVFDTGATISSQKFLPHNKEFSIPSGIVRSIQEDRKGNIWIGTDNGLAKMPKSEKKKRYPKFITYQHDPKNDQSLSHNYILPIFESTDGTLWIGTMGGGINKLIPGKNENDDSFISYTTKNGLPNNVIKAIQEDNKGNLWMSSNRGITKFNPKTLEIRNYDIHDGLQDLEFMEMASCKRHDGEMLFGGINGFNAFYPEDIIDDSTQVKLVLTDFFLSHQRVPVGKKIAGNIVLSESITSSKEIILKHHQNSFSLTFAALHYIAPLKNQYVYMLQGFDNDWIKASSDNRNAQYTNLPFGKYKFIVKASNNDGVWSSEPLVLDIEITPPIWLTGWAYCCYLLLGLAIFWFMRKYSLIRNIKKNELLTERIEREKTDELTQLKLRFFTNISHEFRTPLTLIIGYFEKFNQQWDKLSKESIKNDMNVIGRNAQLLLRLINQLLDFRKFDQGKMVLVPEEADIVTFIKKIYESFKVLSGSQEIDFNFHTSTPSITMDFDKEKMEKIIYNLLSNAFKFTPQGGTIGINIVDQSDNVEINITDTGEGIPSELQPYIFDRFTQSKKAASKSVTGTGIGLSFAKGLVELHKGSIRFESNSNIGTTFILSFPKAHKQTSTKPENEDFEPDSISPAILPADSNLEKDTEPAIGTDKLLEEIESFKILIVEDNRDLRKMIKGGLNDEFGILEAEDGIEGYDLCMNEQPDLVISDVMMPGMDGFELCNKIKSNEGTSHIPIILLTAKTSEEDQIRGFKEGADAYVSKPFSQDVLKAQISTLLSTRRKMWNYFKEKIHINPQDLNMSNLDKKFLGQVIEFIEENMSSTSFTVDQLAAKFRISEVTLNKKLKSLTGKTANSFIRSIRLKKASELLQDQFVSVSEITYQVGFNDLKYFRECFKKEFSVTPSEYRKRLFGDSDKKE